MKKKKEQLKYAGCFLGMFVIGFFLILFVEQWQGGTEEQASQRLPETEYEWTLARLQELEQIAEGYDETQAETLVYIYVRCKRYASLSWVMMAGALPEEFQTHIEENRSIELEPLQTQDILELPNGEMCDFVHLIAVMNMIDRGYPVVGGWGGDLVQLVSSIKAYQVPFEEILVEAKKRLGAKDSLFNEMDIYADLDAVNIYRRKENSTEPTWKVLAQYYGEISVEARVREFLRNQFQQEQFTNEVLREKIYQTFEADIWVQLLCKNYGVEGEAFAEHRRAVAYAFADYCYQKLL